MGQILLISHHLDDFPITPVNGRVLFGIDRILWGSLQDEVFPIKSGDQFFVPFIYTVSIFLVHDFYGDRQIYDVLVEFIYDTDIKILLKN